MKVIVSDVDGTLFPHKSVKNPKQLEDNIDAINRWVNLGNQFAIASARGIREVKRFEDLLGFSSNPNASNSPFKVSRLFLSTKIDTLVIG